MASDFFKNIPAVTAFIGVVDDANFVAAPDDWIVVIADIRSSTEAVEAGQYKDVNMIGGAVICAVQNATGTRDWPFVFGGDGATLLIEPGVQPAVEAALVRTRTLASNDFNLELRVGFVPISVLRGAGTDVVVARYEVSANNNLAMFGGGGVELADDIVKNTTSADEFVVPDYSLPGLPDLTGLSCRWEPLRSQKGSILCVLVKPVAEDFHLKQIVLSEFLSRLKDITGDELDQSSPVSEETLRMSWPPKGLKAEAKATREKAGFFTRLLEITLKSLIQFILERFSLSAGGYDAKAYRKEMRSNSDFCKFDDVLRMVLDCTPEQIVKIRQTLDEMHKQGRVEFGLFETRQALMTCLLFDLDSSEHVHFIDGDDGGFWSASKELKTTMTGRS